MPPASRLGDISSGHGPYIPVAINLASTNVMINGVGAASVGNTLVIHIVGTAAHPGTIAAGSSSVMINGSPAARIGDAISCGGTILLGSTSVNIGG